MSEPKIEIDELAAIDAIDDWDRRASALRLWLTRYFVAVISNLATISDGVLSRSIQIALRDTADLLDGPTIESSQFRRSEYGAVVQSLTSLLFFRMQTVGKIGTSASFGQTFVVNREQSSVWKLAEGLLQLLQIGSQWMLRLANTRQLARQYRAMESQDIAELGMACDELAQMLTPSCYSDPFFNKVMISNRASSLWQTVDRIRYLRLLAQLSVATDELVPQQALPIVKSRNDDAALVYHVNVSQDSKASVRGFIVYTPQLVTFWSSTAWSEWTHRFVACNPNARRSLLRELSEMPLPFSDILGRAAIRTVFAIDTQRGNIPLEVALDSPTDYAVVQSPIASRSLPFATGSRVSFWGAVDYNHFQDCRVDDSSRRLFGRNVRSEEAVLQHPQLPTSPVRFAGRPQPLAFAHYEKWSIADIAKKANASLDVHAGPITRNDFLNHEWARVSILHLATHGHFFNEPHECSNLVFSSPDSLTSRVHFVDILQIDWSHLELVFLNCCVTQAGRSSFGDESLSLAWAFLAGGAAAVIAHRWHVQDDAAWMFATFFYEGLLVKQFTVRSAFRQALTSLRKTSQFDDPEVWGTFVLSENPWK